MKKSVAEKHIQDAGLSIEGYRKRAHHVFRCQTIAGRKVTVVAAFTSSDWRADKNFVSMLKRMAVDNVSR